MSFIADLARLGILPQQHHPGGDMITGVGVAAQGSATPDEVKTVLYGVRITGRDPALGTYTFDETTYGPIHGGAVWRASRKGAAGQQGVAPIGSNPFVPATWGPQAVTTPNATDQGNERNVPLWLYAVAGTVEPTNGPTGRANGVDNLGNSGAMIGIPAYKEGPNGGWVNDGGLIPQAVATPFNLIYPMGYPGALLPMSSETEQRVAFVPSGGLLVAPHHGGDWRLGTPIFDTTPSAAGQGAIDVTRQAGLQQFVRLYKGGSGNSNCAPAWQLGSDCGGSPGDGVVADDSQDANGQDGGGSGAQDAGAGTAGGAQATGPSSSSGAPLNAAGQGATMITNVDLQIRGIVINPLQPPEPTAPKGANTPTPPGSAAGAGKTQVLAKATSRFFGTHHVGARNDKHNLFTTDDGEPMNALHFNPNAPWYMKGKDAPMKFDSSAWKQPVGDLPLIVEAYLRYDGDDQHDFVTGGKSGKWKWESTAPMDSPPDDDGGGGDGGGDDPGGGTTTTGGGGGSSTATGGGGSGTNTTGGTSTAAGGGSTATGGGDGGSIGVGTGGGEGGSGNGPGTSGANPGAPLVGGPGGTSTEWPGSSGDPGIRDGWVDGRGGSFPVYGGGGGNSGTIPVTPQNLIEHAQRIQLDGNGNIYVSGGGLSYSPPTPPKPPTGGLTGAPRGTLPAKALTYAQLQLITQLAQQRLLTQRRPYLRTPMEVAVPALLARPAPVNSFGTDFRFPGKGGMTADQRKAYNVAPVAGKLEAFGNQSGGGWNYQGAPKFSLYRRGVLSRGGFALVPANVDLHDLVAGRPTPSSMPDTHLMVATTSGIFSHADPHMSGKPINGFVHQRAAAAANGSNSFTVKGSLADGSFGNQALVTYATDARGTDQTGTNTVHIPSRGTGTGSGGEFQVAIGVAGSTSAIVHGATARFRVTNTGLRFQNSDLSTMFQLDNTSGPANIAFFGVTPVAQQSTFGALTDSTGGTPSTTYAASGAAYVQAAENNFRASVVTHLKAIRAALVAYGLST